MTVLADEETAVDLDEALWEVWKAIDVPEGFRVEIIEGSIEMSPTGRLRHGILIGRMLESLLRHLQDSAWTARNDINVIHGFKSYVPDLFICPRALDEIAHPSGLGVLAEGVAFVAEVVSPGHGDRQRDRIRKRRAYARAGIPVYVLVDDYDEDGTVTVLSEPDSKHADYRNSRRYSYGTDVLITEGPAKGFVVDDAITRGR